MTLLVLEYPTKKLSGKWILTSIAANENRKLWSPFRKSIKEKAGLNPKCYYSIGRYGAEMKLGTFTTNTVFEKCAAIDEPLANCPEGFEELILEGGLFAVFNHTGTLVDFQITMNQFLEEWLPRSGYQLDSRNHFETFDEQYDPFSPTSVETIYIPLKQV